MEKITIGRTGLKATVAGLGCGGASELGIEKYGQGHAADLVRTAFDSGVNYFDTATVYGTQGAVGEGLAGIPRDQYIISTKFPCFPNLDALDTDEKFPALNSRSRLKPVETFWELLEESLRLLKTDYIDVYNLQGVIPVDYPYVRDLYIPEMQKAREQGKIRFFGITEFFQNDTTHEMLKQCLPDDLFDVVMIGMNILNHSAVRTLLPLTKRNNVGVIGMFAVRRALSSPDQLVTDIERILEMGQGGPDLKASKDTLDFLLENGGAGSIMEAGYRYCRHIPGVHVTLAGTGNKDHLMDNLNSLAMPPLSDGALKRIEELFGNVDCVCGQYSTKLNI